MMKTLQCLIISFLVVNLVIVEGFHHHYMMKALIHGAGMGMMMQSMRPRILPIPIPIPTGLFSGFKQQFERPHVVIIGEQPKPEPKIIIIQGHQGQDRACCW